MKEFRIMIAGGRTFSNYELLEVTVDEALIERNIDTNEYIIIIVSGKAKGADTLGERYARERGFLIEECPAQWNDLTAIPCKVKINQYGKPYNVLAGMNRNKDMVKVSDLMVLFHDGVSKGTLDDVKLAKQYDKDMVYIRY